jgi:hypothetical protein
METAAFADITPDAANVITPDAADPATEAAETAPESADAGAPHRRYLCRHIFADGHRCGSPALRGEPFCYYHHTSRRPKPAAGKFRHVDAWEPFNLPIVEDRASALLVTSHILSRIASNDLDSTRAGHLIRGLQAIARFLPPDPHPATSLRPRVPTPVAPPDLVEDPILDEAHGPLAPIAEYTAAVIPTGGDSSVAAAEGSSHSARNTAQTTPDPDPMEEPALQSAPLREHTPDEVDFLAVTIWPSGYEPGCWPRPATLTDKDIIDRVNAERRCGYYPPLTPVLDASGALIAIHKWPDSPEARPKEARSGYVSAFAAAESRNDGDSDSSSQNDGREIVSGWCVASVASTCHLPLTTYNQ